MGWSPKLSSHAIEQGAAELVENGNILEPNLSAGELAEQLFNEADAELRQDLGHNLIVAYFARLIRGERRKGSSERHEQFRLFEHLPLRITGERDRRVALERATYADVRRYCKLLRRRAAERSRDSVKLKEAETLLQRMEAASKKDRGITVGDMLGLR